MRISLLLANAFTDPNIDPKQLKSIGPLWGSWKTWRAWETDNVLCDDFDKAQELIQRAFHSVCNLHIPNRYFAALNRPNKVKLYEGNFPAEFDNPEEIIAMHLVAEQNDLVLLLGYDVTDKSKDDKFENHKSINYINAFKATLNTYPQTQWVLIDHAGEISKKITLSNLTKDSFDSVMTLLKNQD